MTDASDIGHTGEWSVPIAGEYEPRSEIERWEDAVLAATVPRARHRSTTACGFCANGIVVIRARARECPYCDGTGVAPQGET